MCVLASFPCLFTKIFCRIAKREGIGFMDEVDNKNVPTISILISFQSLNLISHSSLIKKVTSCLAQKGLCKLYGTVKTLKRVCILAKLKYFNNLFFNIET